MECGQVECGVWRVESWSNYKTGSGCSCSCSHSSRVSLCAREGARGRQVGGLKRESWLGNSRNENSARLIIFTYCKTPSRLYRESFNYFSSLFLKLFNANLLPRRVCFFFLSVFFRFALLLLLLHLQNFFLWIFSSFSPARTATFFLSLSIFLSFSLCAGNCNYHFHIVDCSLCSLLL